MRISQHLWIASIICASLAVSAKAPSDLQKEHTVAAVTTILCKQPHDFAKSSDYLIFLYTRVEAISKISAPEKQKEQIHKLVYEYYASFKNWPIDSARAQSFIASLIQEYGLGSTDKYYRSECPKK
jgi:hypothetical protein